MDKIILATRKSPLAMRQTELVKSRIESLYPNFKCTLLTVETSADKHADWSLSKVGGKGLFTKELEEALLAGKADYAVHSAKDLPSELPDRLVIGGYLQREVANDVLVLRKGIGNPKTLATGSPRRMAQLQRLFPDCQFVEIRGNVETRLEKIAGGALADSTVLAVAGLKRLGISHYPGVEFVHLSIQEMVPAVGQGALAIECLEGKEKLIEKIFDPETEYHVNIERCFLELLGGGCQVAHGVYCEKGQLHLFHEKIGFVQLEIEIGKEGIKDWVSNVIKKLNL